MKKESKLLKRTSEEKVLRDPVHDYIHINYQVVWDVLGSREFQRLRRIRQLGGDCMVYHTGDHSRFSHSLGVYELCRRILEEVPSVAQACSEEDRIVGMLAGLLHDIGHGPYSHMFESVTGIDHEDIGSMILRSPETEVYQILYAYDPSLPQQIVDVLSHAGKKPLLESIISSQLDADRMDYLLRDAYCTGTRYGNFDLERILRTLRVHDGKLCIKQSGVRSVEDYILARSQMYWQVYLHPDAFGFELLIDLFFRRYAEIRSEWPMPLFESLFEPLNPASFYTMDESWMQYGFSQASQHPDPILRDLSERLLCRKLFAWKENPDEEEIETIRAVLIRAGMDPAYYMYIQHPRMNQVRPYSESHASAIQVLDRDGYLKPLSQVSALARALESVDEQTVSTLYYARVRPKGMYHRLPVENA